MSDATEQELIEACRRGDTKSYRPLMDGHYRRVLGVCMGMLGCVHEAEDAAQDSMVRGFQQIGSLRNGSPFGPWIVQIARNTCIDALRRRKREHEMRLAAPLPKTTPSEDHEALRAAINRLPLELRLPLVMYYFEGRNVRGVAESLGLSAATVCGRLRDARRELHERMKGEGADEG